MTPTERRDSLSRRYAAAMRQRRWKLANEIYRDLRAVTNAELRRTNRINRKAA